MKNLDGVIARLKSLYEVKTRVALCERMGVPKGTYDTWVNRGRIPARRLIDIATEHGVTLSWLEEGTEPKYPLPKPDKMFLDIAEEVRSFVAEKTTVYGQDPHTKALAQAFDTLDDAHKERLLPRLLAVIRSEKG